MWFRRVAASEDPSGEELRLFVQNIRDFLSFVLENTDEFAFLWKYSPDLHNLAWETFQFDIAEGAGLELDNAIGNISRETLRQHGLEGRSLRFKFQVLDAIANQWEIVGHQLSIRTWFKKVLAAIDAVLDSLIDAAGGSGGVIKEFKDSLRALA